MSSQHYQIAANDKHVYEELEQSDLMSRTRKLQRETNKRRR